MDLATRKDVSCGLADWARIFNAATWEELYALSKDNEVFMVVYEIMRAAERRLTEELRRQIRELTSN